MREPQTEREREMVRQARKMIGVGALILGAVGAGLIYQGIRSDNALLIITPIVVVLPMIFLLIRTQQPPGVRGERRHPSWVEPVHTHPGEEPPPPPDTLPTVVNLHQSQCLTLLTDFTDNRCTEEELHRGLTELQREYRDALNRFSRQQITQYGGTEPHRDPIQLLAKCFTMLLRRQPSELTEEIVDWHIDALKRGEMDEELFQSE